MNFEGVKNVEFFISLGYVTIIASVLTMLFTQMIKFILKKKKIIYVGMDPTQKDVLLSRIGRLVALIMYAGLYITNEYYLMHTINFDGALLTGLLSGSAFTLTIAKGLYTTIKQSSKKKNVFKKLEAAERVIQELSETVNKNLTLIPTQTTQVAKDNKVNVRRKIILTRKEKP